MFNRSPFLKYIKRNFPKGFVLAPEIVSLIRWLERQGQTYRYRRTGMPFLAVKPAQSLDALTSAICFRLAPTDFVQSWFGHNLANESIVPLVHCGADGSILAVWRGQPDRYVFLGSEGTAFIVAETAVDFILLITMGYFSIEMAEDLLVSPETQWREMYDDPWIAPTAVKSWVEETFSGQYPETGSTLRARVASPDPFRRYVDKLMVAIP